MRFRYNGEIYQEPATFLMAEVLHAEKCFEKPFENFSQTDQVMANAYLAIRRVDPKNLSWDKFMTLGWGDDIEMLPDETPSPPPEARYEPDPTVPGTRTDLLDSSGSPGQAPS